MKPVGFKPIHAFLGENDTVAPLVARVRSLSHLQQTFADALPDNLKSSGRIAAMEGSTVVIATANGAVAALLKQMLPRLLVKFRENQKQEQEVTGIRVVVQPEALAAYEGDPAPRRKGQPTAPMPIASLNQLAESLEDSPLKTALEQIRKRRSRADAPKAK